MKTLKAKRATQREGEQQERYYRNAREQMVCSCGRPAVGLTGKPADYLPPYSVLLVCDYHNHFPTKAKYFTPPIQDFNPANPEFSLNKHLSQVPFYNFEKNL